MCFSQCMGQSVHGKNHTFIRLLTCTPKYRLLTCTPKYRLLTCTRIWRSIMSAFSCSTFTLAATSALTRSLSIYSQRLEWQRKDTADVGWFGYPSGDSTSITSRAAWSYNGCLRGYIYRVKVSPWLILVTISIRTGKADHLKFLGLYLSFIIHLLYSHLRLCLQPQCFPSTCRLFL